VQASAAMRPIVARPVLPAGPIERHPASHLGSSLHRSGAVVPATIPASTPAKRLLKSEAEEYGSYYNPLR
jgi:hypothetical protein